MNISKVNFSMRKLLESTPWDLSLTGYDWREGYGIGDRAFV